MGRRLPSSVPTSSVASPLAHLPILAAFIALVVLSLVAALCASHHRKPSKSRLRQRSPAPPAISSSPDRMASPKSSLSRSETKTRESAAAAVAAAAAANEVVMTATAATHGPIPPIAVTPPSNSRRKLSVSMSLKLADGLARVRTGRREAHPEKERSGAASAAAAAAGEESVWMKTIILGEKCRVPSEHDDEEEEAAAVYDENGNRRRNYHPRTPRSLPISRSNSFFNVEVFPS